ncbi:MAG TPA: response regulator [Bryobacteraceae bacterium]|nr:response regulator [Bryobacteraceae bacterium]
MATILIVDDHETNRDILTTLLGYWNHRVVEAGDGVEGLEHARSARPDLIITDVLMPRMDGYEFTRRLREDPDLAATPVIFYSAQYLMQDALSLAAKCGVKYILAKPAEAEELLSTVNAALGLNASPAALSPSFEDFDREHVRVLTDKVSAQAEEVENLNARLEALIDVTRELNVAHDPWSLVERYTKEARRVIGAVCASACITDESGRAVRRFCSLGVEVADPESPCPKCAMGGPVAEVLGASWSHQGGLRPGNLEKACSAGIPAMSSYLVVPILTRAHSYGWLGLGSKLGNSVFSSDDETLLMTLAAQLAMGYENSRLFDELKGRAEDLEREAAERRQSAERYRMVVEQASDGIAVCDKWGQYVEVNPRMLDLLGYTRDGFLRLNARDLIHPEDLVNDQIPFAQLQPAAVFQKERRLIRADGSLLQAEISTSCLEDGRVLAIARDVTERKRLEADLRQSQKLEAVGRLAGGVAHDFNNLLTVILGHSDLALSNLDPNDPRRRDIEDIREAGARAAVLTSQMLAFSRKQMLQPKVFSIDTAVANLIKMLGRLITSNIEIVTRHATETWQVKMDPGQLDQVILNLALNGRDAMPLGGQVVIETMNRRIERGQINQHSDAPAGDYVVLSVSDTGTGMDTETRSHLFEPFFTTKMPGKGTGLGLATVYGIVRQSGGYISVESELGRGTTVEVHLPRSLEAGETARPRAESGPLPVGNEVILLAEDEERVRSLTARVLAQQGYKVIEACDGQAALEIAERCAGEIHLLVSDIMMPRVSGPELAETLRRTRPGIKVLLISGYTGGAVAHAGGLNPTIPLLQKPFTPRTLSLKVRETLDATAADGLPEDLTDGATRPAADNPPLRYPA